MLPASSSTSNIPPVDFLSEGPPRKRLRSSLRGSRALSSFGAESHAPTSSSAAAATSVTSVIESTMNNAAATPLSASIFTGHIRATSVPAPPTMMNQQEGIDDAPRHLSPPPSHTVRFPPLASDLERVQLFWKKAKPSSLLVTGDGRERSEGEEEESDAIEIAKTQPRDGTDRCGRYWGTWGAIGAASLSRLTSKAAARAKTQPPIVQN